MSEITTIKRGRGRPRGRKIYSWKEYYTKKKADPVRYKDYLAKQVLRTRKHYASGKGYVKAIETKYGLSLKDYSKLLENQNNVCAVCFNPPTTSHKHLAVDHDHVTGKVRGLLCTQCNRALGLLKDSKQIVEKLLEYLNH